MRTRFAVCLAFALGVALGATLSHPRGVRADASVMVRRVELHADQARVPVAGDVVGFACTPTGNAEPPNCFIATR
jgi:hypothetical protein